MEIHERFIASRANKKIIVAEDGCTEVESTNSDDFLDEEYYRTF